MKQFIIFVCTDSAEIFFSKLRSAGLNYNLPSFFTESYCAGVSNKHCLLTFFIIPVLIEIMQANSGDPDQTPHSVASDLGLHYLPMSPPKRALGIY